ncbi:MAG: hypothetical protein ACLQME_10995 [Alphaproteobacteria bacterium]
MSNLKRKLIPPTEAELAQERERAEQRRAARARRQREREREEALEAEGAEPVFAIPYCERQGWDWRRLRLHVDLGEPIGSGEHGPIYRRRDLDRVLLSLSAKLDVQKIRPARREPSGAMN